MKPQELVDRIKQPLLTGEVKDFLQYSKSVEKTLENQEELLELFNVYKQKIGFPKTHEELVEKILTVSEDIINTEKSESYSCKVLRINSGMRKKLVSAGIPELWSDSVAYRGTTAAKAGVVIMGLKTPFKIEPGDVDGYIDSAYFDESLEDIAGFYDSGTDGFSRIQLDDKHIAKAISGYDMGYVQCALTQDAFYYTQQWLEDISSGSIRSNPQLEEVGIYGRNRVEEDGQRIYTIRHVRRLLKAWITQDNCQIYLPDNVILPENFQRIWKDREIFYFLHKRLNKERGQEYLYRLARLLTRFRILNSEFEIRTYIKNVERKYPYMSLNRDTTTMQWQANRLMKKYINLVIDQEGLEENGTDYKYVSDNAGYYKPGPQGHPASFLENRELLKERWLVD